MEVTFTAGNCQKSPAKMTLTPPKGRRQVGKSHRPSFFGASTSICSRCVSISASRASPGMELHSSMITQRTCCHRAYISVSCCAVFVRLVARMATSAKWCSVRPSIKAACVFCGAKANSASARHAQIVSKKLRNHFKVWLLPEPGTPCKTQRLIPKSSNQTQPQSCRWGWP